MATIALPRRDEAVGFDTDRLLALELRMGAPAATVTLGRVSAALTACLGRLAAEAEVMIAGDPDRANLTDTGAEDMRSGYARRSGFAAPSGYDRPAASVATAASCGAGLVAPVFSDGDHGAVSGSGKTCTGFAARTLAAQAFSARTADRAQIARTARRVAGLARQIGLTGLARAAGDVAICALAGDTVALAATSARVARLGSCSLHVIGALRDHSA